MCFSATASFAAAGLLTAVGAATLRRARRIAAPPGLMVLAAFPLVFGVQQALEGLVWLSLHGVVPGAVGTAAGYGFLFFALCFWPVAGPVAGFMIEPEARRRRVFAPLIALGVALALFLAVRARGVASPPVAAPEWSGHLAYLLSGALPRGTATAYFVTASAGLLASSNPHAFRFGVALALSFGATVLLYEAEALVSVWCFFAAICSLVIAVGLWREAPAPDLPHDDGRGAAAP